MRIILKMVKVRLYALFNLKQLYNYSKVKDFVLLYMSCDVYDTV